MGIYKYTVNDNILFFLVFFLKELIYAYMFKNNRKYAYSNPSKLAEKLFSAKLYTPNIKRLHYGFLCFHIWSEVIMQTFVWVYRCPKSKVWEKISKCAVVIFCLAYTINTYLFASFLPNTGKQTFLIFHFKCVQFMYGCI